MLVICDAISSLDEFLQSYEIVDGFEFVIKLVQVVIHLIYLFEVIHLVVLE